MQNFYKSTIGKEITFDSESSYSIETVKEKIQANEEIPKNQ